MKRGDCPANPVDPKISLAGRDMGMTIREELAKEFTKAMIMTPHLSINNPAEMVRDGFVFADLWLAENDKRGEG